MANQFNWINPRNLKPAAEMTKEELLDTLNRWPPSNVGGCIFYPNGKFKRAIYADEYSKRVWADLDAATDRWVDQLAEAILERNRRKNDTL